MRQKIRYEESLVLKVNELFHDLEGEGYGNKHEDIFIGEKEHWQEVIPAIFPEGRAYAVVEVGTGTGFVATQVCPRLSRESTYHCTDISEKILDAARKNLSGKCLCQIEFVKVDGKSYPLPDRSVDVVVLNSVLHHIPNLPDFFSEVKRMLKSGGKVVIGHEPNKSFFSNRFLWGNYRVLNAIFFPQQFLYAFCKFFGIVGIVKTILRKQGGHDSSDGYVGMVRKINDALLSERKIKAPLSEEDISAIIDIHSPTAGRNDLTRGIDIRRVIARELPGYKICRFLSYNYLHKLSGRNLVFRAYETILGKLFPEQGATFFVVISAKK